MICGIVENDPDFAAALKAELDSIAQVSQVRLWSSGEEFWRGAWRKLDLCLIDPGLPGISGIELIELIRAENGEFPCIVISALNDEMTIVRAIESGAEGYIWKGELRNLAEVIKIVLEGGAVISPSIAVRLMHSLRKRSPRVDLMQSLSTRELQVFKAIAEGRTAAQTAALFGTTEGTVRNQIKSIYKKLTVRNRVELMKAAARYGLLDPNSGQ